MGGEREHVLVSYRDLVGTNLCTLLVVQRLPVDGQYFVSVRIQALLDPPVGPKAPCQVFIAL